MKAVLSGCLVVGFLLLFLTSCGHVPRETDGRWTASWYGEPFHGRKTASGEVYNMHEKSAAHKTLPLGTRLKVTYPPTGRSTVVTVNDRGPFVRGRDLDLSLGAARAIGMVEAGVAVVDVQVLGIDRSYGSEAPVGTTGIFLQAASFGTKDKADRLSDQLVGLTRSSRVVRAKSGNQIFYRVLVGPYPDRLAAEADRKKLAELGMQPLFREFY